MRKKSQGTWNSGPEGVAGNGILTFLAQVREKRGKNLVEFGLCQVVSIGETEDWETLVIHSGLLQQGLKSSDCQHRAAVIAPEGEEVDKFCHFSRLGLLESEQERLGGRSFYVKPGEIGSRSVDCVFCRQYLSHSCGCEESSSTRCEDDLF